MLFQSDDSFLSVKVGLNNEKKRHRAICFFLWFLLGLWINFLFYFLVVALCFCLIRSSFFLSSLFPCLSPPLSKCFKWFLCGLQSATMYSILMFDYTLCYIMKKSTEPLHTLEIISLTWDKLCHPFRQFVFPYNSYFIINSEWHFFLGQLYTAFSKDLLPAYI